MIFAGKLAFKSEWLRLPGPFLRSSSAKPIKTLDFLLDLQYLLEITQNKKLAEETAHKQYH